VTDRFFGRIAPLAPPTRLNVAEPAGRFRLLSRIPSYECGDRRIKRGVSVITVTHQLVGRSDNDAALAKGGFLHPSVKTQRGPPPPKGSVKEPQSVDLFRTAVNRSVSGTERNLDRLDHSPRPPFG
jgi:hypothetical protein